MSEPFLSEIRMFAFSFAPRGWANCDGQLLPIDQNQSIWSLLGTTYGGDGRTTFALPDLRGRAPIHFGTGPDGAVPQGGQGGQETVALTTTQMPAHTHAVSASGDPAGADEPATSGKPARAVDDIYGPVTNMVSMNAGAAPAAGGGQSHDNMQPYLVIRFCIALQGLFPS